MQRLVFILIRYVVVAFAIDIKWSSKCNNGAHVLNFVLQRAINIFLVKETETLIRIFVDVTCVKALPDFVQLSLSQCSPIAIIFISTLCESCHVKLQVLVYAFQVVEWGDEGLCVMTLQINI